MKQLLKKIINRETIAYLIAGVLTTIVNIVIYHLSYNIFHIENLVSNAIAWVIAVIFAYIVNDKFVFLSEKMSFQEELKKFWKFIIARLVSFGFDELGMFLLVDISKVSGLIAKIVMNVFVVIINYFFSKWFVFTKKNDEVTDGD